MAARGPKTPGARFSEKNPDFLKFIGPVTFLWVLQSSQIVHLVFTESPLARAVFTRLIRVLGWQPRAPKPREHDFPKKRPISLKFIGPVTPLWVLYPSKIMHMGFTEPLLARAVFTRSNKVPGWQPGAPKFREHDFPKKKKKKPDFLKFIEPVTTLWVLQSSQTMHMVYTESLPARAVFTRLIRMLGWQPGAPKFREYDLPEKNPDFFEIHRTSDNSMGSAVSQIVQMVSTEFLIARAMFTRLIRVLGWQPRTPKLREHDFPKKTSYFFEIHRTSDTSMGSVSLRNHACGLSGASASQGSVYKVN